jgi:hypothetical protein
VTKADGYVMRNVVVIDREEQQSLDEMIATARKALSYPEQDGVYMADGDAVTDTAALDECD